MFCNWEAPRRLLRDAVHVLEHEDGGRAGFTRTKDAARPGNPADEHFRSRLLRLPPPDYRITGPRGSATDLGGGLRTSALPWAIASIPIIPHPQPSHPGPIHHFMRLRPQRKADDPRIKRRAICPRTPLRDRLTRTPVASTPTVPPTDIPVSMLVPVAGAVQRSTLTVVRDRVTA